MSKPLFVQIQQKIDQIKDPYVLAEHPIIKKLLAHPFMQMLFLTKCPKTSANVDSQHLITIFGGFLRELVKNLGSDIETQQNEMKDYLEKSDIDFRVLDDFSRLGHWMNQNRSQFYQRDLPQFQQIMNRIIYNFSDKPFSQSLLKEMIMLYLANGTTTCAIDYDFSNDEWSSNYDSLSNEEKIFSEYFKNDIAFCLWYLGVNQCDYVDYSASTYRKTNRKFSRMIIHLKMDDGRVIKLDFTTCPKICDDIYDLSPNILGLNFYTYPHHIDEDDTSSNRDKKDIVRRNNMQMISLDSGFSLWEVVSDIVTSEFTVIDISNYQTKLMLWRVLKMMKAGYIPKITQYDLLIDLLASARFFVHNHDYFDRFDDYIDGTKSLYLMALNYLISVGTDLTLETLKKKLDHGYNKSSAFLENIVCAHVESNKLLSLGAFMKTWCDGLVSDYVEKFFVQEKLLDHLKDYHEICKLAKKTEKIKTYRQEINMTFDQMDQIYCSYDDSEKIDPTIYKKISAVMRFKNHLDSLLKLFQKTSPMAIYLNQAYGF